MTTLSRTVVEAIPKVLLHEHLDGGLRPGTVLELATEAGYGELPVDEPEALAQWFFEGADRGSLGQYLEGFRHTIAVMQTADALQRVAYEALEDLAREKVVYAELRFAPHFHTAGGLGLDAVMVAVLAGMRRASRDHGIGFGLIVSAMRNEDPELSIKLAELAIAYREQGCVGFDLAGEEAGHPANHHLRAFQLAKRLNFSITIHAGESFGPESIWQALQYCGAHRIGHGVRLIEDVVVYQDQIIKVGGLAQYMLDQRIPLEICLSSNLHTGAVPSMGEHPFPIFEELGLRVTLNTDNRLMSRTTMTDEYMLAVERFDCTLDDLERFSINAMKSAFIDYRSRCDLIFERIIGPCRELRRELGLPAEPERGSYA